MDEANFGPVIPCDGSQVHVLVELPPVQNKLGDWSIELCERILYHVLAEMPLCADRKDGHFKQKLVDAYNRGYGAPNSGRRRHKKKTKRHALLRCMLLNTAFPPGLVETVHLFPRQKAFMVEALLGFADINDVRNGLLLFVPLKRAFDQFQVCFIYDDPNDAFRLKVFDPSLRPRRLVDVLNTQQREQLELSRALSAGFAAVESTFDMKTTFGDLKGLPLCFGTLEQPFRRCLNLQARSCRSKAVRYGWMQPHEGYFNDFPSEGMTVAKKMELLMAYAC